MRLIGGTLVKFSKLSEVRWGAMTDNKNEETGLKYIIFPDGFTPDAVTEYDVQVKETKTGRYTYNGEKFIVCYAKLTTQSDRDINRLVDVVIHRIKVKPPKAKPPAETSMSLALKEAGLL